MAKYIVKSMAVIVLLLAGVVVVSAWFDFFKSDSSPTLEIYPKTETNDGSLIWFESNKLTTYEPYITSLINLLQGYKRPEKVEICDAQKYSNGIPCDINMKYFGPCGLDYSPSPAFGYDKSSPCVFLKIKLNNFKLQYYNHTKPVPTVLQSELKRSFFKNEEEAKKLYISCQAADAASQENIGATEFYPTNMISDKFLHSDGKDYVDPLIAFRLLHPTRRVLINIECRMWAENIDPQKNILRFGVMID